MACLRRGDPSPFFFPADPERGVLLVHGFSGTPFELRLLGEDLAARGYSCAAPLLPGHGGSARALADTSWPDWLRAAEEALLVLRVRLNAQARLAVVGLSMGGLLCLELCRRHRDLLRAACLLATPLWLPAWQSDLIAALARSPLRSVVLPKLIGSDVRDRQMRSANPCTRAMPVMSVHSLCAFMAAQRARLHEIDRPMLLAHGVRDHTVPYACLGELAQRLGTPPGDLRCLSLPRSYHLITLDVERETLFSAIADHLACYLS